MKSIKIFLAVLMIVLASNVLSGCDARPQEAAQEVAGLQQVTEERSHLPQLAMARMDMAQELKKTVELKIELISESDEMLHVQLQLDNPEQKPITSVESWISFSSDRLRGVRMDVDESLFELAAPYENGFDERGRLKLGRATATPVKNETIILAELWFEKTLPGPVILEAYDYQYDLSGHQSVNMMHDDVPINILLKPNTPLLITP